MRKSLLALAAAATLGSGALAAPAAATADQEASIHFVNLRSLRTFDPVSRETIYFQDWNRQWYRASVLGFCFNLPWATRLGVDTHGTNSLDRFSTIIVDGDRCQLNSLVRSGPPPKKQKHRKA